VKDGLTTYTDGSKFWYLNNTVHRDEINPETGLSCPAIEDVSGIKYWVLNSKLHREDGPAIEWFNGDTAYYIDGIHIPQLDNKHIYGKEKLAKLLILL
jgi:hypothetical protein